MTSDGAGSGQPTPTLLTTSQAARRINLVIVLMFAFAVLDAINAGEGWPHKGTINGLTMANRRGEPPGWMVTLDDTVIGDCGTHGRADETGVIEIGYGLAEPFRGQTYGTELVGAMTEWLLAQPGIHAVRAGTLADNVASRRVLEKNGFSLTGYDERGQAVYQRA